MIASDLVSIVMPAYNAERFIKKAIESILSQSHENFELLIADDASTDKTRQIIDSYNDYRIKVFHNEKNLGYLKTCNKLLLLTTGDLITFQDADDFSDYNRIAVQLDTLKVEPDLFFCGTWFKRINEDEKIIAKVKKPKTYEEIIKAFPTSNPLCGATIMFKRKVLETIGVYRDFFDRIGNEDYDWIYLVSEKYKGVNIPEYLYSYRQNFQSVSQEISLKRFLSKEVVVYLGEQRKQLGIDDLQKGDTISLRKFVDEIEKPFVNDSSLIFRKYANIALSHNNIGRAFKFTMLSIKANPFKPVNYYFLYLILIRKLHLKN